MSPMQIHTIRATAWPAATKFMGVSRSLTLVVALFALAASFPGSAAADGPSVPIATSYRATVTHLPAGLQAKVVDGYQQLWLSVPPGETVVVPDYRGAPWVRFDRNGVSINENSEMYYLDQTPVAETPPANLKPTTPPHWTQVSSGHSYMWREGRLHGLISEALAPGTTYVGSWIVPITLDGRRATISGALWHANAPSLVWFWPIVVMIACVLAGWRLRRPKLDTRLARGLALSLLAAITVAAAGRELHGRPTVGTGQLVALFVVVVCVTYGASRVLRGQAGYFLLFAIAFASLWAGGILITTLLHPFVLMVIPGFLARCATVVCLGGGISLILVSLRMLGQTGATRPRRSRGSADGGHDSPPAPGVPEPLASP
jgi:hypothetical protein